MVQECVVLLRNILELLLVEAELAKGPNLVCGYDMRNSVGILCLASITLVREHE